MGGTFDSYLVRILKIGQPVGTGFLVKPGCLLTCAHVVNTALGRKQLDNSPLPDEAVIYLDFPLLAPNVVLAARAEYFWPLQGDHRGDIAGLRLLDPEPKGAQPPVLVQVDNPWDHDFRALGFPKGYRDGLNASGLIKGKVASGWFQLDGKTAVGGAISPGFSGGPVWDEQAQGVVGMVEYGEQQVKERIAFMTPVKLLLEAWGELEELLSGIVVFDRLICAELTEKNGEKKLYSSDELDILSQKVLQFLEGNTNFHAPQDPQPIEDLQGELDGVHLKLFLGRLKRLAVRGDERAYLLTNLLHQDFRLWATQFVPLAGKMDIRKPAESLLIPMQFSEFVVPQAGSGEQAQITYEPLEDITLALEKHQALVLLGEPGSGKTTALQKIAFDKCLRRLAGQQEKLPIFVRLGGQGNLEPYNFLNQNWVERTGINFTQAIIDGRLLILADGLNELPREDREQRLKAWRLFVKERLGACQIVFTSRERDYSQQLDLPRVRIEPLDPPRILEYLRRYKAEGLLEQLADPKTNLGEMARNPFYLALLTSAYQQNQTGMTNRGALLGWFVEQLYRREEQLAHPGWIPTKAQEKALSHLAFTMQEQGESTVLDFETAEKALPNSVRIDGENIELSPALLFRFARAASLLDPAVSPQVRFYHHLVQEYFAALQLLEYFREGKDLHRLWDAPRLEKEMPEAQVGEWDPLPEPPTTGWEMTTILACGLAPFYKIQPEKLIQSVQQQNPLLAGRCLDECGYELPNDLRAEVAQILLAEVYDPAVHLRTRLQACFVLGRIGDPRLEVQEINGVEVILPALCPVPGGEYTIGSQENDEQAYQNEQPANTVVLQPFLIGKRPVTNAEFGCFFQAGGYRNTDYWQGELARRWLQGEEVSGGNLSYYLEWWRYMQATPDWKAQLEKQGTIAPKSLQALEIIARMDESTLRETLSTELSSKARHQPHYWDDRLYNAPNQPVVGVTWFEARAYCAWLTAVTGKSYRLPTEVEWEGAARGHKGWRYPWGNDWDPGKANTIEGRGLKPSPVGVYAAKARSPYQTEDQSGNVWEWTSSLHLEYPYNSKLAENEDDNRERVLRGGAWIDDRRDTRCAFRVRFEPDFFDDDVGFRVLSPGS